MQVRSDTLTEGPQILFSPGQTHLINLIRGTIGDDVLEIVAPDECFVRKILIGRKPLKFSPYQLSGAQLFLNLI